MIEGRLPSAVRGWRTLAALLAAAMVLALLPFSAALAEDRLGMTVLEGEDNVAAAIAWSQHAFPGTPNITNVILGRDDLPPDNLASGMLQGVLRGPLLLNPTNALDADVKTELARLQANVVHILGGLSAISANVESALKSEGYAVRRYSGASRLETAQEVARQHGGAATTAFLARAFGSSSDQTSAWADALAGGAWSAEEGFPVLFTQTETLTASTRSYLQTSRIRTIVILGGTGAVGQAVEDQLKAMGLTVRRVSGPTRFATAIAIAEERGFDDAGDAESIVLADGQDADGWAAGFAAAGYAADKPIVLSNGNNLPSETDAWFANGANDTDLTVAPYVAEAAATAAANKLDLGKKATVTVDTSVASNEDITGTIAPMEDVKSATIAGDCVQNGTLSPNATSGAFTVDLLDSFTGSTCVVQITVTYVNDETQVQDFTITISGPGPNATVMDGPELTEVSVHNETTDHVVVRYVFDEAVTIVDPGTTTAFEIIGFDSEVTPPDQSVDGDGVRPHPTDTKSVIAAFPKEKYLYATAATVLPGAVYGSTTQEQNPEGSRPLKAVTIDEGNTVGPDLERLASLKAVDVDGSGAGTAHMVQAIFEFDDVAVALANVAPKYQLMTDAGAWRKGFTIIEDDGNGHTVEFGSTDPGATFATKADADTFIGQVRRAMVEANAVEDTWGQRNILQTVNHTSTVPSVPTLKTVTLLPSTHQVRYYFHSDIFDPVMAEFFVFNHEGTVAQNATAAAVESATDSVLVTFPAGTIDGQTTAGGTDEAAVDTSGTAVGTTNRTQTLGASNGEHPYTSGTTLAPDLVKVIRAATGGEDPFGGSQVTSYTVTFRFNKDVAQLTTTANAPLGLKTYSKDGDSAEFNVADAACARGETASTKKDVICTVAAGHAKFGAVKDAVRFAVEGAAVTADTPNTEYANYATSVPPSSS